MAISAANLKFYQCTTWTEGDTHGGAINTSAAITTNTSQNIFDNVEDAERSAGDTEYRKIFFRNENADAYNGVKAWIDSNTPATNSAITVLAGGSKSVQGNNSAALTGTCTFAASTAVTGSGTAFLTECAPGELIFNSTDDTNTSAKAIASIESNTALTLGSAYAGTTGSSKEAKLAPITSATFVTPTSKSDGSVLSLGDLVQNASKAIWIKRVITAAGDGYTDDTFTIKCENS